MGLSFIIAASPRQRSHSRVRVPWDHILLSQFRDFSFRRLLRLAGLRWKYWTPPPHGIQLGTQSQSHIATDGQSVSQSVSLGVEPGTQVKVTLRLTVSQSVSLGVEPPSGAHDQIFISLTVTDLLLWGVKVTLRLTVNQSVLVSSSHLGLMTRYLLPFDTVLLLATVLVLLLT
jgi:hypothetical protein